MIPSRKLLLFTTSLLLAACGGDATNKSDTATITKETLGSNSPSSYTLDRRVRKESDDAEEHSNGNMDVESSDLELVYTNTEQKVGVRFKNITVPPNATITNAYIQFKADETSSGNVPLTIHGQAHDDARTFTDTNSNITSRILTIASASWSPAAWNTIGESGSNQRTSELKTIVQEITSRAGWANGNDIVFIISSNSLNKRVAESFDGDSEGAPLLHIEYTTTDPGNDTEAPTVPAGLTENTATSNLVSIQWTASSDNIGVTGYRVYRDGNFLETTTGTSYTDSTVQAATSYEYTVSAYDAANNQSSVSSPLVVTTDNGGSSGHTIEKRVNIGSDDAEESPNGDMYITSSDLELVYNNNESQNIGIRFNNLTIPTNATITRAYIRFQVDETSSGNISLTIHGQDTDNASTFVSTDSNITSRIKTTASAGWSPAAWNTVGQSGSNQRTSELKTIVQEITSRAGWASGNAIAFLISSNSLNKRVAEAFEGDSANAPLLHIEYTSTNGGDTEAPSVPAGLAETNTTSSLVSIQWNASTDNVGVTGYKVYRSGTFLENSVGTSYTDNNVQPGTTYSYTVSAYDAANNQSALSSALAVTTDDDNPSDHSFDKRVNAGSDDAEEYPNGDMYLDSSDLELIYNHSHQKVGIRFKSLPIPKNAVITNAYIQFQVDETSSGSTPLTIHGQDTNNASTFTSSDHNISSRTLTTASVGWSPAVWNTIGQAGSSQRTSELKTIVQEITSRAGWSSGNAIAFIMSSSSSNKRVAEAFDGDSAGAPLLHIEYTSGGSNDTQAPSVPSGLTKVSASTSLVSIQWNASTDNTAVTGYRVFRNGLEIGTSATTNYNDSSVQAETTYSYTVKAYDAAGNESTASLSLSVTTPTVDVVPTFNSQLVRKVLTSGWTPPSPSPAGITYITGENRLLVSDSEVNETINGITHYDGANLFKTTLSFDVVDTWTTLSFTNYASEEPTGSAFKSDADPSKERLFISDDDEPAIFILKSGDDAIFGTADDIDSYFLTDTFNSLDPEGIAYGQDTLFIADGLDSEIYKVSPGADGIIGNADDVITSFDTESLGVTDPEGIAFNTDTGHLYIVGEPQHTVIEVTTNGVLVRNIVISAAFGNDITRTPAGLAVAPSSNNPEIMSLYIVNRGVDNNIDPSENDGKVYEMTLPDDDEPEEAPVFKGGFETGNEHQWQELHYNESLAKERQFSIVTSPVRHGLYAAKMVVHNGDKYRETHGERCDLKRSSAYDEKEGDEYWYAWSTFFPEDWQAPTSWFLLADWHSTYTGVCQPLQLEVTTNNDIVANVLTGDVSGYQCFTGSGTAFKNRKVIVNSLEVNKWNDFIFHVKWTTTATGVIEIFHKTEDQDKFTRVLNLQNIPTLQYQEDINNPSPPYFKLAHYRSTQNTHTSTLYHDGFRQGKTKKSIASGDLYLLRDFLN